MATAFRIEHRLGIAAPAPVVWEALSDLDRWSEWNPLYPQVDGELRIGAELHLTEAPAGREPGPLRAKVLDWVPNEQILWTASERWGLVRRLRYLEIEKLSEEGCIFANGEDWSGRLARYVDRGRRRALYDGMAAMSEALRDRALGLWQARRGNPKSAA